MIDVGKLPCKIIHDVHNKDNVSYYLTDGKRSRNAQNDRCYSDIMIRTTEHDIYLKQRHKDGFSEDFFNDWIKICRSHNLIPSEVKVQGYMKLHIPKGMCNFHQIYSTLCCFRWIDAWRHFTWNTVRLYQELDVSFWQVFHYTSALYISNVNHSFSSIGSRYFNDNKDIKLNLSSSIALKRFYEDEEFKKHISQYTSIRVDVVRRLLPILRVQSLENVLDKKFTPLYNNIENLHELYKELVC